MFDVFQARIKQKHRTMTWPKGPPPTLPEAFQGFPILKPDVCAKGCDICVQKCPTEALSQKDGLQIDLGACLFCGSCAANCPTKGIIFSNDWRLASSNRENLLHVHDRERVFAQELDAERLSLYKRSFKLRQVSAGGCGACEADTNVLCTVGWDLQRFGIQFVASPRHADGILITGPVSRNMRDALWETYEALPEPRVVIVVGSCAISGGPFASHPEIVGLEKLKVDLYIPGCPPHPLTILDGLLRLLGKVK